MTANDDGPVDVLIVGPAGHRTGGIARYIDEQRSRLPATVSPRVYDLATPNGDGARWFLAATLLAVFDLCRFPFRRRPDVVHVHTSHRRSFYLSSGYVFLAKVVWQRSVVVHVHGSGFDRFVADASQPVRLLQTYTFGAADTVIALSEYWRTVVEEVAPPEKVVVVPNAVEATEYDPDTSPEPPHVVFVSNHIERKGLPESVSAMRTILSRREQNVRVSIAGSGPLSHLAEDLATECSAVEYLGYVSEAEKRALLDSASIYVLPTHAEGLPIALIEGMAGGNAVVSTDVGGIPDLLDEENGLVVRPGDEAALTAAIEQLLTDPDTVRAMAERNRALVEESYSWPSAIDDLTALYASLDTGDREGGRRRSETVTAQT